MDRIVQIIPPAERWYAVFSTNIQDFQDRIFAGIVLQYFPDCALTDPGDPNGSRLDPVIAWAVIDDGEGTLIRGVIARNDPTMPIQLCEPGEPGFAGYCKYPSVD